LTEKQLEENCYPCEYPQNKCFAYIPSKPQVAVQTTTKLSLVTKTTASPQKAKATNRK
jgi:hypothetical protein